jgi:hypothetical protein
MITMNKTKDSKNMLQRSAEIVGIVFSIIIKFIITMFKTMFKTIFDKQDKKKK